MAMATRSPKTRHNSSYKRKPTKILDYGEQECMNAINNNAPKASARKRAEAFGVWLRKLLDEDCNDVGLYLADDCLLQWFGRTVKSKKDVSGFLKYDAGPTVHHFVSIAPCDTITLRKDTGPATSNRRFDRCEDSFEELATPIEDVTPAHIVERLLKTPTKSPRNKRTRSFSSSPEAVRSTKKKHKLLENDKKNGSSVHTDISPDKISHKNNARYELRSMNSKKLTPEGVNSTNSPVRSPSASRDCVKSKVPRKNLDLSYLPRSRMEAECILKFATNRNKKGAHLNEWERQCKVQVAYSENPVCKGEYIIWTIVYTDNNKCRRNLLPDFEAVSRRAECEKL